MSTYNRDWKQFPDVYFKKVTPEWTQTEDGKLLKKLSIYKGSDYSRRLEVFSGTDVKVTAVFPTEGKLETQKAPLTFGNIQTLSVSTTRSISPVRTLGRTNPVAYTRGARTIAGTMVFASINSDIFEQVLDVHLAENMNTIGTSLIGDVLPPFCILIQFCTENGVYGNQLLTGVTLVNYGTTYSIDDLYTEVTYSYVAQDITPIYGAIQDINSIVSKYNTKTNVTKKLTNYISDNGLVNYYKDANGRSSTIMPLLRDRWSFKKL